MGSGLGSPQYDRHQMLRAVYHDAKLTGSQMVEMAGGPVRCASQLVQIWQNPHLSKFADEKIKWPTDRVRMII